MITNSISESVGTRKRGFKILTAVITVLFACSVTITAFASANTYEVTVIDGEKSVSITTKSSDPGEIVRQAGIRLGANDELDLSDYSAGKGGTIVIERAKIIRVGQRHYFIFRRLHRHGQRNHQKRGNRHQQRRRYRRQSLKHRF